MGKKEKSMEVDDFLLEGIGKVGSFITKAAVEATVATVIATVAVAPTGIKLAVAGVGAAAQKIYHDNKVENARDEGRREGYNAASKEYEEKLAKQAEEFYLKIKDVESDKEAYEALLDKYEDRIEELEEELKYYRGDENEIMGELTRLKNQFGRLKSLAS